MQYIPEYRPPNRPQIFMHLYVRCLILLLYFLVQLYGNNTTAPRCVASGYARKIGVQESIGYIS
jgi:hypothetical protein